MPPPATAELAANPVAAGQTDAARTAALRSWRLVKPGVRRKARVASGTHRTDGLRWRDAPSPHRPWDRSRTTRVNTLPHDSAGVRMHRIDGKLYDHPVAQAQYGLWNLATFRAQGDRFFLSRARLQADRLIETKTVSRDAWWHPYPFDFRMTRAHGITLRAPWYSGMAQGEALSLFAQLALTERLSFDVRARYRTAAEATYRSLLLDPDGGKPWVSHVDADGYVWFQEYPRWPVKESDFTLNGHGYAAWGVWDYHRLTGDAQARRLFEESAATYLRYAAVVRRNGWMSSYCTPHEAPSGRYHEHHIQQLLQFLRLTGDGRFAKMADAFLADFSPPEVTGDVQLQPGRHRTFAVADRRIAGRRWMTLLRPRGVHADRRVRIKGRNGYFYRLAEGKHAGRYVREIPGVSAMPGSFGAADYYPAVVAPLSAGRYTALRIGATTTEHQVTLASGRLAFDQRLTVAGVTRKRVAAGPLRGLWLPHPLRPDQPPGRPGKPRVLKRDGNTVRLIWSRSHAAGTVTYAVQVHRQGRHGWQTVDRTTGTLVKRLRLRSANWVDVRVRAENSAGRSQTSRVLRVRAR